MTWMILPLTVARLQVTNGNFSASSAQLGIQDNGGARQEYQPVNLLHQRARAPTKTSQIDLYWLSVCAVQVYGGAMPFNGRTLRRLPRRSLKVEVEPSSAESTKSCFVNYKLPTNSHRMELQKLQPSRPSRARLSRQRRKQRLERRWKLRRRLSRRLHPSCQHHLRHQSSQSSPDGVPCLVLCASKSIARDNRPSLARIVNSLSTSNALDSLIKRLAISGSASNVPTIVIRPCLQ